MSVENFDMSLRAALVVLSIAGSLCNLPVYNFFKDTKLPRTDVNSAVVNVDPFRVKREGRGHYYEDTQQHPQSDYGTFPSK